uniref:Uncharacterized protein n=1 Tax=Arundo donax TaxID=35708 RepID=A0A0A8YFM3_ARUDO
MNHVILVMESPVWHCCSYHFISYVSNLAPNLIIHNYYVFRYHNNNNNNKNNKAI